MSFPPFDKLYTALRSILFSMFSIWSTILLLWQVPVVVCVNVKRFLVVLPNDLVLTDLKLFCLCVGYRFFKATMFLTGFMFGALISYVVIRYETVVPVGGKIGILVAAGLLCGIITMLVQYVGLFMTGFMLGQLVAVMLLIILEQFFYHLSSRWIAIGILFGCGVVFALLNLYFRRGLTIISSSTIGAAAIAVGLDYFVEDFVMLNYIEARIHVERGGESVVCWYSWTLLAVWPLLSLVGIGIQWRVTGADIDYKDSK